MVGNPPGILSDASNKLTKSALADEAILSIRLSASEVILQSSRSVREGEVMVITLREPSSSSGPGVVGHT